jgi:drug/metabolite transporter (DMT)-like permease
MRSPAVPQVMAVPPDPDRRYSTLKGVGFALCGYFLFATADALTKTIVNVYSSFQIIPMQVVFASLPIVAMIVRGGGFRIPRGINLALLGLRGLLAGLGAILGLYAFRHLPLADVYALAFCAPLIVTVLAIPILGERVGPRRGLK